MVVAKCGEPERRSYLRRLAALGLPVSLAAAGETTSFAFRYDADGNREMRVEAIGEPWGEGDEPERALRRVEWVHVAPVLRGDFTPETLERIARRRRVLLDGHGLVRRAPSRAARARRGRSTAALLRHVSILKLSEEEARAIVGDGELEELRGLGVPEVVVTFGAGGSLVLTRDAAVRLTARPSRGEPTGAGDAFSVAYLSARAGGHRPSPPRGARARSSPRYLVTVCYEEGPSMIAAVGTVAGVFLVDVEAEELLGDGNEVPAAERPEVALPRVVAAARSGSTVVAVVERRPPLMLSNDGGATWREAGGGLPPGFAVAIAEDDPDRMLYAARNRLYVSANGGVFWRSLPFELPDIDSVGWID